jgi:hypothetical protein
MYTFKNKICYKLMSKNYECNICNIKYKTRDGLYKHIKNKHNSDKQSIIDKNLYKCNKCNKEFKYRQSKWRHENSCKNTNAFLIDEVIKLSNKIDQLENKNNINYNNTINDNRKIIINYSPGTEPINYLSIEQQKDIIDQGFNSLLHLIKITNFDDNKPEYHSYCVTALNDKHASILDKETQTVVKTDKHELFDNILSNSLVKLQTVSNNKLINYSIREEFIDKLERLKKILFEKKKGINKYYSQINLLSFNNKEKILKTWDMVKKSLDNIINEENLSISEDVADTDFNSDDENSDYDSDSDIHDNDIKKIIIKNKTYILEDNKLYKINNDCMKGKLYGSFINGKIIKL